MRQSDQVAGDEVRDGVTLTNLGQPLFPAAQADKRDLVDYLDAVSGLILPGLRDRPLSVIRVLRGQAPFMQKNVPAYAPPWVQTVTMWAESSRRQVSYALCNDRRTLLWFANQRAVEFHPGLLRAGTEHHQDYLVLDLDPPDPADPPAADPPGPGGPGGSGQPAGLAGFRAAVRAALLVREALTGAGLAGTVKTSGAKGVHVLVPVAAGVTIEEAAAATRAIAARAERLDPALATTAFIREDRGGKVFIDSTRAGGATLAAAYSPRARPGVPVSFPVAWEDLDQVTPADFTIRTVPGLISDGHQEAGGVPPQPLSQDLIEEGRAIPIARVQAMHEGKRRARARRQPPAEPEPGQPGQPG
ncbi:MAG: ATP-dependent DNA ligase [Actinobacteria bacterium]|nr:ATP-dependent DNA ligase [Actinomycetota bacterium]